MACSFAPIYVTTFSDIFKQSHLSELKPASPQSSRAWVGMEQIERPELAAPAKRVSNSAWTLLGEGGAHAVFSSGNEVACPICPFRICNLTCSFCRSCPRQSERACCAHRILCCWLSRSSQRQKHSFILQQLQQATLL